MSHSLGMLETTGFTPALVALDVMAKASPLALLQAEINDFLGICIKVEGPLDGICQALEAGRDIAQQMGGRPVVHVLPQRDPAADKVIQAKAEYNPLIQQDVVHLAGKRDTVADQQPSALGFIETQGFTAVFAAIDEACKAANVKVLGKEKLGGGYVTVVIQGDVAAVQAAIDAGGSQVEGLGNLIATHVIARPSDAVLSLLPAIG